MCIRDRKLSTADAIHDGIAIERSAVMRNRWSIVRFAGHGPLCGCLRPRNLRLRNAVMGLLIAAFVLMGVSVSASIAPAYAVSASASPASALAYDAQEMAFLGLINDYRADHGRGPLVLSDQPVSYTHLTLPTILR